MSLREQWIRPLDALPLDYQHVIAITSSGQEEEMYLVDDKWHIVDGVRIPIEFIVFWHEKREQSTVEMAEDCVKREDAKKFLYERLDRLNDDELYDIFSKIIDDMYNELPSVTPKTRWIPVSERLPKENEYIGNVCKYYLIQDEYGDMHVAHLSNVGWIPMDSLKAIGNEVIAWRELPQSYKAESEET